MRRIHLFAARLAIIAMLIDALLPTAVSAAARFDATAGSLPLCSAAGTPHPTKEAPALPMRHCALCAAGAACVAGLLPSRQGDGFAGRFLVGFARPKPALLTQTVRNIFYDTAQPRAPPTAFS